jgi:hypothetical protein
MCFVPYVKLVKLIICLIWRFLTSSKGCSFPLHSSSKIMLWSNMFAIKMFQVIFWSHCQQGLAIMWKWDYNTPNACSTSFLRDSCEVTKWFFPPPRFMNCLYNNQPMWIYSIKKQVILSILILINHKSHIKPNTLQEIRNKRTMIKKNI